MKTPLPKFPHHRGVPKHHFGDKTPLLATLGVIVLHNKKKQKLEDGRPNYTMQFIKNVSESLKSFGFGI